MAHAKRYLIVSLLWSTIFTQPEYELAWKWDPGHLPKANARRIFYGSRVAAE